LGTEMIVTLIIKSKESELGKREREDRSDETAKH